MKETKFKNTEIGRIPEDWKIGYFGDIFTFFSNNTLSRDMLGERGYMHNVHYGDVLIKYGSTLDVEKESIPSIKEEYCYKSTNKIEDGDVIIADTAEDETVGKACEILNVGSRYIVSGLHTIWVRPKGNLFAAKYLGYAMNGTTYHNQLLPLIQGTKVSSISKAAIKDTCIIVPPINEQHSIASALTNIDNLISSLGKLIEKKKNIKQGSMQQLLTGKTRLKGFSEPWMEKKLGEVCSVKRGVRVVKRNLTTDGLYPVYQNTNIPLGYSNQYNVEANTPFVIIGGSAGQVGICRKRYWAADDCAFFACHDIYKEYLYYVLLLNQRNILHNVRTGTIPRLDRTFLSGMLVYISSNIAEQQAIATILTKMDDEITALEAKKTKYEAIKQGMMQQLLTGKIRLIS